MNKVYSPVGLREGAGAYAESIFQEENCMISKQRIYKRVLSLLLVLATVITGFCGVGAFGVSATVENKYNSDSLVRTSLEEIKNVLTSTSYDQYRNIYRNAGDATATFDVDLLADLDADDSTASFNFLGGESSIFQLRDGAKLAILCGDDGRITFRINVPETGFYNVMVGYFTGGITVHGIERDEDGKPVLDSNGYPKQTDELVVDGAYSDAAIERYILIDGKVPYSEARSVELPRVWNDFYEFKNADGETVQMYSDSDEFKQFVRDHYTDFETNRPFAKDGNGNELKPDKELVSEWADSYLYDSTGYYGYYTDSQGVEHFDEPLGFYLEAGEHTISFQAVREAVAIDRISFCHAKTAPTYEEYYASKGGDSAVYKGDAQAVVQGEYPTTMSERTIYQLNNRSSVISQPQDPSLIRLNMIGGEKWEYVGQWVEWEVEVPEAGFYSIVPRSKQSYYSGLYVSRKIYINDELPFREACKLRFDYTSDWVTDPLWYGVANGDSSDDIEKVYPLFYLNKGVNTIRMEVVLGDMSDVLRRVNESLTNINAYYRKILMITGASPDKYRDYRFERLVPDVLKGLREESDNLYEVSEELARLTGGMGENTATLDRVANVCYRMGHYPTTIASYMSSLKDYTASLGTWLTDTQNQPLDVDYLCVQSPDADRPRAEAGFFTKLWGGVEKFFWSFFSDYDSLGSTEDGETIENGEDYAVEVWTATSRDQAQIVRSLVDDSFSVKYGIPVVVKLVAGGTLLPATLAGTGPDVYMGAAQGDPVNYAIRSAVLSLNNPSSDTSTGYNFNDLSRWADDPVYGPLIADGTIPTFDKVVERFAPAALRPLTLYGQTYALPETMSFNMMFYRKDIFVELDIAPPDTWDEFYQLIYTIDAAGLDIGAPTGVGTSTVLMYQQDETYYQEGNYDEYLDLFRTYYNEVGYDKDYDNVDDYLASIGYTYVDADGNVRPTTDGIAINLDSDVSLAAFRTACNLFTQYGFPISYVLSNRFRSGEMPLAIADYTNYNALIIFAPEINGLWEFTPLPGMVTEDPETGETVIDNTTVGAVSAMMMMRSVNEKNALGAWSYMQWWMSADVQSSFGNEMVALLGPSAKQATANMEALAGMSWSKDEYDNLFAQFNAVECTPEYPGSYIVGRYTNFAFLNVYNDKDDPLDAMRSYITDINNELTRKRNEFNLPTADTIKDMEEYLTERDISWTGGAEGGN